MVSYHTVRTMVCTFVHPLRTEEKTPVTDGRAQLLTARRTRDTHHVPILKSSKFHVTSCEHQRQKNRLFFIHFH